MNGDFIESFYFYQYTRSQYSYKDNRQGVKNHYFGYLIDGSADIIGDRGEIHIKEGDFFYIPMHCRYQSYWHGDPDIRFISLGFRYFPDAVSEYLPLQIIPLPDAVKAKLFDIPLGQPVNADTIGRFYLMLSEILPLMKRSARCKRRMIVEKSDQYISEHPSATVGEISEALQISESSLYAAYRHATGGTPVEARHRILSEKAALLLTTTDLPIEQISDRLAFSSPSYFRKIFKAHYGTTPRNYRNTNTI